MTDTPQDDGLVERLRATDKFVNDPASLKPRRRNPDGPEAADHIAALRAENEALREALEVCAQTMLEVEGAQVRGAEWYTRGASGLYQQVAMHVQRANEAITRLTAKGRAMQ